jgi:hypothetical protein
MRRVHETTRPQTSSSTVTIQGTSVFGINNKASLIVPVNALQYEKNVSTTALIDSGAQGNFIDWRLAHQFDSERLPQPICMRNIDGSTNQAGEITHQTHLKITMGEKAFWIKAFVTNLGFSRIILGDTWLQEVNPQIDWPRRRITINRIHTPLTLLRREEMSRFTTRDRSAPVDLMDTPLEMAETTINPTHAAWAADARAKLDPWRYMMLLSNAGYAEVA